MPNRGSVLVSPFLDFLQYALPEFGFSRIKLRVTDAIPIHVMSFGVKQFHCKVPIALMWFQIS